MISYEQIINKIESNNKKINRDNIHLIAKYIISLVELNIIKDNSIIEKIIDKVSNKLENIVYYDNNDAETLEKLSIGKDNKGLSKNNIIYVNKNMPDEMIKITLFHELTHFLQRFYVDGIEECIGIMQNWKWRILIEAQTQNIAEMIYSHIFNIQKETKEFKSEELRMLPGGIIKSNLRNYEMYDYILKKLLISLDISIEKFISMNFNEKDSMKQFEEIIDNKYGPDVREFIWELLDVIYSTDVSLYVYGIKYFEDPYEAESLFDGRTINISSSNQYKCMQILDELLLNLTQEDTEKHSKLLDNQFIKKQNNKKIESELTIDDLIFSTHYENGVESNSVKL